MKDNKKYFSNLFNAHSYLIQNDKFGGTAIEESLAKGVIIREHLIGSPGTIHYKNGDVFEGIILNNKPCGKGKIKMLDGTIIKGEFIEQYILNAVVKYSNNSTYNGNMILYENNYCFHQYGKYVGENGMIIEGDFSYGFFGRNFIIEDPINKTIYEGVYIGGFKSGKGKLTNTLDGSFIEGDWWDDKASGLGKISYANGNLYEGLILENIPHGIGKMTYSNGNGKYYGEFRNGRIDGYGEYTYANGVILVGYFINKKFVGGWLYNSKWNMVEVIWSNEKYGLVEAPYYNKFHKELHEGVLSLEEVKKANVNIALAKIPTHENDFQK